MNIVFYCLSGLITLLALGGFLLLKRQLREITNQLRYRRTHQTSASLFLEVNDRDVQELVQELSKTLKQESELRIRQASKEEEFKELIANVSHDLRTPLTVIKGYLQLMEQCEDPQAYMEYLAISIRHADELEKRIEQLFAYSYWVNQEEERTLQSVNAANLLSDILTDFVPVFEEKGIRLRLTSHCMVKIFGDEEYFRHVIQNLLNNALHYTTGDVEVSLERASRPSEQMVCITVKNPVDTDCDLEIGHVFDRFYTGSISRKHSTGLGLTIVKLLVEKMEGEVNASAEDGSFAVKVYLKET